MKHKLFTRLILMIALMTSFFVNKAYSCIDCSSNQAYETPFIKITEDKHYIKPGSIVFSADGLFLLMQGHLIPINSLQTDPGGIFIPRAEYPYGTCPNCKLPLNPRGSCLNPRCPFSPYYDPDY